MFCLEKKLIFFYIFERLRGKRNHKSFSAQIPKIRRHGLLTKDYLQKKLLEFLQGAFLKIG